MKLFKIDLIVWKCNSKHLLLYTITQFKIDLIVWKSMNEDGYIWDNEEFKIDLIVWKYGGNFNGEIYIKRLK